MKLAMAGAFASWRSANTTNTDIMYLCISGELVYQYAAMHKPHASCEEERDG